MKNQVLSFTLRMIVVAACASQLLITADLAATPTLANYSTLLSTPGDSGTGPTLWFRSARTPNLGSAGEQWEIGAASPLIDVRSDFFGNPSGAFGLPAGFPGGAAISGSGGQSFASGPQGSVILSVQTTGDIQTLASIFSKGVFVEENPFEITLFQGNFRINYRQDATNKGHAVLLPVEPNTWYTILVRWDMSLSENPLRWHVIDMDRKTATEGALSPLVVGDMTRAVRVAGRPSSNPFFGSLQNIAIYNRYLGDAAVTAIEDFFGVQPPTPKGAWKFHEDLSWVYEYEAFWAYSYYMGYLYLNVHPWLFLPKIGWILSIGGNNDAGAWMYSVAEGWIFVSAQNGGMYLREDGTTGTFTD